MRWLYLLAKLGLGACLADDMGLGKTIQVLVAAAAAQARSRRATAAEPAGRARFAAGQLGVGDRTIRAGLEDADRASVRRSGGGSQGIADRIVCAMWIWSSRPTVRCCARRGSRKFRGVWWCSTKRRQSRIPMPNRRAPSRISRPEARLALTGTPVENRLGDLWSLFDFINPGLLGSAKEFTRFAKRLAERPARFLRPSARTGEALYSAAPEDRQERDLGSAGQNRDQGVLPAHPSAGGVVRAGGEGTGRATRRTPPESSAKGWCCRS